LTVEEGVGAVRDIHRFFEVFRRYIGGQAEDAIVKSKILVLDWVLMRIEEKRENKKDHVYLLQDYLNHQVPVDNFCTPDNLIFHSIDTNETFGLIDKSLLPRYKSIEIALLNPSKYAQFKYNPSLKSSCYRPFNSKNSDLSSLSPTHSPPQDYITNKSISRELVYSKTPMKHTQIRTSQNKSTVLKNLAIRDKLTTQNLFQNKKFSLEHRLPPATSLLPNPDKLREAKSKEGHQSNLDRIAFMNRGIIEKCSSSYHPNRFSNARLNRKWQEHDQGLREKDRVCFKFDIQKGQMENIDYR
jgi:hypothetical protein